MECIQQTQWPRQLKHLVSFLGVFLTSTDEGRHKLIRLLLMKLFCRTSGLSLPYSSSSPADSQEKLEECIKAGEAMKNLLAMDIKPRDIMTKGAFENAIRMVMMTGGSTNAVLHLIAMSRSCQDPEVAITLDDFQRISNEVWICKSVAMHVSMFLFRLFPF